MTDVIVVELETKHLEACVAIAGRSPLLAQYGHTDERGRKELGGSGDGITRLVALQEDVPAGFLLFVERGAFARSGYLKLIVVDDARQSAGVGAALIAEMERRFLAPAGIVLLCTHTNEGAQRFYERLGYVRVGALRGYVQAGLDELVFFKPAPASGD